MTTFAEHVVILFYGLAGFIIVFMSIFVVSRIISLDWTKSKVIMAIIKLISIIVVVSAMYGFGLTILDTIDRMVTS